MKKIKFILMTILCLFLLSSCEYQTYWEEPESEYVGETTDFVITKDKDNKYHISKLSRNAYGKQIITIPNQVEINGEIIYIDYVDKIFSYNPYVRKVIIEFNNHNIYFKNCVSLRIIEINEEYIHDPSTFLSGMSNLYVYIPNATKDYSNYEFYKNNTVMYSLPLESTMAQPYLTTYDKTVVIIDIIILGLSLLAGIVALSFYNNEVPEYELTKYTGIFLFISPIIYAILFYFKINNLLLLYGLILSIPLLIGTNLFQAYDLSSKYKVLNTLLLLLSSGLILYKYLSTCPSSLGPALLVSFALTIFLALILNLISKEQLYIPIILIFIAFITFSIYLVDLFFFHAFQNLIGTIIAIIIYAIGYIGIVAIPILLIACFINMFRDTEYIARPTSYNPSYTTTKSSYQQPQTSYTNHEEPKKTYPYPDFGFMGSKIKSLPEHCYWDLGPHIDKKPDTIKISGTIKLYDINDKDHYERIMESCNKKLYSMVDKVLDNYYYDYPDADGFNIKYNISYKGEYWE